MADRFVPKKVTVKANLHEMIGVLDTETNKVATFNAAGPDDRLADVVQYMNEGDLVWVWTPVDQLTLSDFEEVKP